MRTTNTMTMPAAPTAATVQRIVARAMAAVASAPTGTSWDDADAVADLVDLELPACAIELSFAGDRAFLSVWISLGPVDGAEMVAAAEEYDALSSEGANGAHDALIEFTLN